MDKILRAKPKPYPAPGFLDRLQKICEDNHITLKELAEIVDVTVPMLEAYSTSELKLDEITLHKILNYSGVDWMWLEHGYDSDPVVESHEKMGMRPKC